MKNLLKTEKSKGILKIEDAVINESEKSFITAFCRHA